MSYEQIDKNVHVIPGKLLVQGVLRLEQTQNCALVNYLMLE